MPISEDCLFNFIYMKYCHTIKFSQTSLYCYDVTINPSSLTKKIPRDYFGALVRYRTKLKETYPDHCGEKDFHDKIINCQKVALTYYAHNKGIRGFSKFARTVFDHPVLKEVYGQSYEHDNRMEAYILQRQFGKYVNYWGRRCLKVFVRHYAAYLYHLGLKLVHR